MPGNGLALRTLTYVDDTVTALIALMNNQDDSVVNSPVNIGSSKPSSLLVSYCSRLCRCTICCVFLLPIPHYAECH